MTSLHSPESKQCYSVILDIAILTSTYLRNKPTTKLEVNVNQVVIKFTFCIFRIFHPMNTNCTKTKIFYHW